MPALYIVVGIIAISVMLGRITRRPKKRED
jgi:hypothetical protein